MSQPSDLSPGAHHGHEHPHDFASANRDHFNETAHEYDDRPHALELARRLGQAIRKTYPSLLDEDSTAMMDFACGTGLISRELCPYVKSIVGVDISPGMVEQFNLRASNQGLAPEEMQAVCVELKGSTNELNGQKFDVIVCALAYHHFSSIEDTTRIISTFLKPGGSLLVADIMKSTLHGEIFPDGGHIVAHQHGFDEEELRRVFEGAALIDFAFTRATSGKLHGHPVDFFLARGILPNKL
ncbi:hypothetical protein IEO21_07474 [Rhodonia placenta]|uniref:Methyltransferase type 11 domain-containing protein n=1 Tax=Rhodonia placenta TaxID=104341 RepID=A0A8H7TZR2_9APHY|nr:hypothetical protein IEO21_07474 [Postia placenta]